jgi:hypothetical protein
VELINLRAHRIGEFGSHGVTMARQAICDAVEGFAVEVARFHAGSLLGRHPTRLWQLFSVVAGSGWVSGPDGARRTIGPGEAVLWGPGEMHESGTEVGMTVVIVESPQRPDIGEGA